MIEECISLEELKSKGYDVAQPPHFLGYEVYTKDKKLFFGKKIDSEELGRLVYHLLSYDELLHEIYTVGKGLRVKF